MALRQWPAPRARPQARATPGSRQAPGPRPRQARTRVKTNSGCAALHHIASGRIFRAKLEAWRKVGIPTSVRKRSRNSDLGEEQSWFQTAGFAFPSTRPGSSATLSHDLGIDEPTLPNHESPGSIIDSNLPTKNPLGNLAAFAHFSAQKRAVTKR